MSIASELTNLESNIGDAYDAVNDMSGIIPQHKNMANLDQAIRTIPQNAGTTYTAGNGINIDANNEISIDDTVVAELSDIPTVNDATLTIQHNGTTVQTFTANQSTAATANIETIWADDAVPATQVPPVTTSLIEDEAVTPAKLSFGKYSTTKQQVGIWIDNRPVYRIVITGTTASATSERVSYPTGVNIGGLVNVYGGLTGTNGYIQPFQRICADGNVSTFSLGLGDFVNGQFTFHHTAQDYWGADYHIVIEYIEPAA